MIFKDPWVLFLIPLIFAFPILERRKKKISGFRFSSLSLFENVQMGWKVRLGFIPSLLRSLVFLFLIIALAGPRNVLEETVHKTEGIDIVLAIDCSGSMAAEDFKINGQRYNRLVIVKNVVKEFVDKRKNDRIGLIAFGGVAYTVCPLTTDYDWLLSNLDRVDLGLIQDGTAIGSALNSSVERLKKSTAKSRIIILLTDGVNNAGKVNPLTAAQVAKSMKIKVYTIGAGTRGYAPFPVQDFFGRKFYQNVPVEIDEKLLQNVADATGGRYFRATDTETLKEVYSTIDQLERTKIEQVGYKEYKELFYLFLLAGLFLLFCEILLSHTILMRIP